MAELKRRSIGPKRLRLLRVILADGQIGSRNDRRFVEDIIQSVGAAIIWQAYKTALLSYGIKPEDRYRQFVFEDPSDFSTVFYVTVEAKGQRISAEINRKGYSEIISFIGPIELEAGSLRGYAGLACAYVAVTALGGLIQNSINMSATGISLERVGAKAIDDVAEQVESIAQKVLSAKRSHGAPQKRDTELEVYIPTRRRDGETDDIGV